MANSEPVHCKNCRRGLGMAGKFVSNIVCRRTSCRLLGFPNVMANEDRDGVIEALERLGLPRATIASVGNVSTQRVQQILAGRS